MSETEPNRFDGASCTATLDPEAQTLTFEHRGFGASAQQKALSPLVVPLGAIGEVDPSAHPGSTGLSRNRARRCAVSS